MTSLLQILVWLFMLARHATAWLALGQSALPFTLASSNCSDFLMLLFTSLCRSSQLLVGWLQPPAPSPALRFGHTFSAQLPNRRLKDLKDSRQAQPSRSYRASVSGIFRGHGDKHYTRPDPSGEMMPLLPAGLALRALACFSKIFCQIRRFLDLFFCFLKFSDFGLLLEDSSGDSRQCFL